MAFAQLSSAKLEGDAPDAALEGFCTSSFVSAGVKGVNRAPAVSTALIIAAGQGSRLNHGPKPLHRLLGVPLLARTLNTLEQAGIRTAYVVTGYKADLVRRGIEQIDSIGIEVVWLRNEAWEEPNGLSVLAAREAIREPFVLAMADHIFDPNIVTRLIETPRDEDTVLLAVDRRLDRVADLDDATKVQVEAGDIELIAKSLVDYNAVDTGLFVAGPSLFDAVDRACVDGHRALADGIQTLAREGKASVVDVTGMMWHDVDTPADIGRAERKLLRSVRKPTDGPISRYLNRPLSTALSRLAVKHTGLKPNHFTLLHLMVGLGAAVAATLGGYVGFLVAGILFHASSVLDGCDGEIAKLSFKSSPRGEWLDTAADGATFFACLLGLTVGAYRSGLAPVYFYFGVLGLGVTAIVFVNLYAHLVRSRSAGSLLAVRYGYESGTGWFKRFLRFAHYLGKRDFIALFVLVLAVFGQLQVVLVVCGSLVTLLLLPASIKVNVQSWLHLRRAGQRRGEKARPGKGRGWFPSRLLAPEAAVVGDRPGPTVADSER
jgi:choline kinase/phosphatidylglycerophosphate synthase